MDDRVLAGVCGGLATYMEVDPVWVRLGFVAGTLFWGVGLIVYALLWITLPRTARRRRSWKRPSPGHRKPTSGGGNSLADGRASGPDLELPLLSFLQVCGAGFTGGSGSVSTLSPQVVITAVWPVPVPGTRWLLRLPNWVGDAVMVLPALRALPHTGQEWIGVAHPRVIPLYQATGLFRELHPARGAAAPLQLGPRLHRRKPDRTIVFTDAPSGAILAGISQAPLRAGRGKGFWSSFYSDSLPSSRRQAPLWKEFLEVSLAAGGTAADEVDFGIDPGPEARSRVASWCREVDEAPVALAPGAAYGPAKRWLGFPDLARELTARGKGVVVVGGEEDREAAGAIHAAGVLNLVGRTNLLEAIALLERCSLLVTNDSGAMHLGRAAGTQVVALFGSSSPDWTGPGPKEGTALWTKPVCSPCFRRKCPLLGDDHLQCLRQITMNSVLEAMDMEPQG